MLNDPKEITYENIIESGNKLCIGHSIAYSLHISGHYFVAYVSSPIRYVWVNLNLCKVNIYYEDGAVVSWISSFFDAYITQYGISISSDGEFIFAQTWENGLYCFSCRTGEKIWRTKSKSAVKNIYVNDKTICINRQDKRLELLEITTGEVISERKITIREFFPVDFRRFMCRSTSKKWEIIDSATLETTNTFSNDDTEAVRSWFSIFYA